MKGDWKLLVIHVAGAEFELAITLAEVRKFEVHLLNFLKSISL